MPALQRLMDISVDGIITDDPALLRPLSCRNAPKLPKAYEMNTANAA